VGVLFLLLIQQVTLFLAYSIKPKAHLIRRLKIVQVKRKFNLNTISSQFRWFRISLIIFI